MAPEPPGDFGFIAIAPAGPGEAILAIAASRAGALGSVNLADTLERDTGPSQLEVLARFARRGWGVVAEAEEPLAAALATDPGGLEHALLPATEAVPFDDMMRRAQSAGLRTYAIVTSVEEAAQAERAGADALIAKGCEAGGWVGETGSFVLLQQLVQGTSLPVWAAGGIGLNTVTAAYVGGAAGAVLDSQLLLTRESPLPESVRSKIESMDGSETAVFGADFGMPFRAYNRPGLAAIDALRAAEKALQADAEGRAGARQSWRSEVTRRVGWQSPDEHVMPVGQDAAFAGDLARRFNTVGGVIAGLRAAIRSACATVRRDSPLAEDAPLARSHGTRYPVVQGPMTRVSDRAEFAAAVAEEGALPFLALALMRAPEAAALLAETARLLDGRPWGVGILGFVPQQLRAEQLEVIGAHHPPFALIAGGRPDQAAELEANGIATYLHVPSPGLLELYLAAGARRFVFEGRECGGHVGPRTSFVLWDTMMRVLVDKLPAGSDDCHVLLAGGVHDGTSAAMAAATAAEAAKHSVRVGVLLGTAYLYTSEATECGAITPAFQQAALAGHGTVLLESAPGHATRCLPSPFSEAFEAEKRRLREARASSDEVRDQLEQLNVGRLRIAAKGVDRNPASGGERDAPKLVPVAEADLWERGLFMIGQAAALHERTMPLAELHSAVCHTGSEMLQALPSPEAERAPAPPPADVAIIGMSCILPGAGSLAAFWDNVLGKVDAVGEVPLERWDWRRYFDPDPGARDKVYSRWGGFIDDVEFDPIAFGMPPNSLRSIEPFQLLALVTAQSALRDAGYATRGFNRERTAVVLGAGGGGADLAVGYTVRSALPSLLNGAAPELEEQLCERLPEWTEDSFAGLLMNVAAGRIANRLDLGGANYTVDAACASSLTAVSLAVRELQGGTSDMVLAGGIDAIQNPFAYLCFSKTHALSPNGRCRPFDAEADGIAIGEGFATVVLKRLEDAERDGDRIYAVVSGVGAASDGRDRSLTAPRPEGQMRALRRAYAQASISPASVGLIEAHGTGTVAGDGAEVTALSTVFAEEGAARQACAIGSVKSMIGHTKATAGVAGLIKAALALRHRVLPPTIGVSEPNPKARFDESPFYVNTETRPWLRREGREPRRAGVSAFGFGGTDFHVVLEEYAGDPTRERSGALSRWPAELLAWRGDKRELTVAVQALEAQLAEPDAPELASIAAALAAEAGMPLAGGGTLAIVAESLDDLRAKLRSARELLAGGAARAHTGDGIHWAERPYARGTKPAFLFPGQGSHELDMGRELALAFPDALEAFEQADELLGDCFEGPLSGYILPPPAFTPDETRRRQAELTDTHIAQPALGATELAYLRVLRSLGVEPGMSAGHSYGELVALCAAGVLTEDALLRLSETRGRCMAAAAASEAGAMAAVGAAPGVLQPFLDRGDVVTANLNAPDQTVLSGPRAEIEAALDWCREQGLEARMLPVACAFHSPHVAPARDQMAEALRETAIASPSIPVYSNTTGARHSDDPEALSAVLAEHLVRPVDFVREVEAMYDDGARLFVEVGPRSVLTGLVGRIIGEREHLAIAANRRAGSALKDLLGCLAGLVAEGVSVDLERLYRVRAERSSAPERMPAHEREQRAIWLVNGGRARPAGEPEPEPDPLPSLTAASTPPVKEPPVSTTTNNGGAPSVAPPQTTTVLPPADRAGDVMGRYHAVMQHFLDTQRAVMLSYLGGPRAAVGAPPPPALPALAPAVLPARAERLSTPLPEPEPAPAAGEPQPPAAPLPVATNGHGVTNALAVTSPDELEARLLAIVSERTGYPVDMLDLEADLEADLGIDSIKRVEIAGTLTSTLELPDGAALDVEELTGSRTLAQVIAVLATTLAPGSGDPPPTATGTLDAPEAGPARTMEGTRPFEVGPVETERIGRFMLQARSAPAVVATAGLAAEGAVVIVDDGTGVGDALADELARRGEPTFMTACVEPADRDAAESLRDRLRGQYGGAKALVHLAALGGRCEDAGLGCLLLMAQALEQDLATAAARGGAVVLGATQLGGSFGIDAMPAGAAPQAAIAGFVKTLSHEWQGVRAKVVDLSAMAPELAAERLLVELTAADGAVEIGYAEDRRTQPMLAPAALDDRPDAPALDADSVLLVTGGARGITAHVTASLAERYRPTLVLVGRTPADAEETADTAGLDALPELRAALIERRRREGSALTPALVERECRNILHAREVRANLARIRATGARVDYRSCDVADAFEFGELIESVYEAHGRIDGVIHGAGVIEDRLVRDKEPTSLERVMATKAGSARTLVRRLRPDSLRFAVFFSSVSGRFGNRGQADYAGASEMLNKLAHELDQRCSAHVVSINWGPWATTGMVSPEVARQFAERGVALIPVEAGCRLLDEELRRGRKGEVEVVISAATAPQPALLATGAELTHGAEGALEVVRRFDLARDRFLDDHRVDGRAVLPFAVAMELMAEAAAAVRPGLEVGELRDIRLLHGVTIDDTDGAVVRVAVAPGGADDELEAAILTADGSRRHYQATVRLGSRADARERPLAPGLDDLPPFAMSVDAAYRELLFHGPQFQGIAAIEGMDERGAVSRLEPSTPERCLASAEGTRWLLDPVLLDSALQVQVIWARLHWDVTLLPSEIHAHRRAPGGSGLSEPDGIQVRHELLLRPDSEPPFCRADHRFYLPDGRLLATLEGVVGVGTAALNRLAGTRA